MTIQRPKQAVILAGGRGTRLQPLTNHLPKPMITFHGKPFLEYLVELLKAEGFDRILMLLGYLPEKITKHFGDGKKFGLRIDYLTTNVDDDTGTRLRHAKEKIDKIFFLLYCDNYWPLDIQALWKDYVKLGCKALVTVYDNTDRYTLDNLKVSEHGIVETYDKSRKSRDLLGVDIGFLVCQKSVLDLIPITGNPSFEANVYPMLIKQKELAAHVSSHRYYSVGSHERLSLTSKFLSREKIIFLDRDGTLNIKMARGKYVCSIAEWEWIPGALTALKNLKKAGYTIIVITNQPGVARQKIKLTVLEEIHEKMKNDALKSGGSIDAIYFCPHDWDEGCSCRKPEPGLLFQAQKDFSVDLSRLTFIGDDDRDGAAAKAAGVEWLKVTKNKPILDVVTDYLSWNN